MKYLTFEGPLHQEIILFSSSRQHSDMLHYLQLDRADVIGAGSIYADEDTGNDPQCVGQAISLGIVSRGKADTDILLRMLKNR